MTSLRVLGAVEICAQVNEFAPRTVTPTPPKVRQVLALLMMRANYVVPAETLISELWDQAPPRSAVTTVQTYVYHLRKFFAAQQIPGLDADNLRTYLRGYVLEVDPAQLDVTRFRAVADRAHDHLIAGRYTDVLEACTEALSLWRGPALANVPRGRLLEAHATHLEEERLRLVELRFDAAFALGMYREQIPQLRSLVAMYPLNEGLHARLITALQQAQRRSEALAAYQNLRQLLDVELGLDPSPHLQQLQLEILSA